MTKAWLALFLVGCGFPDIHLGRCLNKCLASMSSESDECRDQMSFCLDGTEFCLDVCGDDADCARECMPELGSCMKSAISCSVDSAEQAMYCAAVCIQEVEKQL